MKMQLFATLSFMLVAGVFASCASHPTTVPLPPLRAQSGRIAYINYLPTKFSTEADSVIGTLYVVGADGLNPHPVMKSECSASEPAWSRDGMLIAFGGNSKRTDRANFIYVVNADGTNLHSITEQHAFVGDPSWSPDDREIAYHCREDSGSTWSIHIIGLDGKNDRKIGSSSHTQGCPCWSSDGKRLLFHTQEKGWDWDVAVMNTDGSGAHKLTPGPAADLAPACSPDGSKIAFWSTRTGSLEIFTMNSNGTNVKQLTHEDGRAGIDISRPAWSPDGKYIAYSSCRTPKKMDVLLINMQGQERCLTTDVAHHVAPSWASAPKDKSN